MLGEYDACAVCQADHGKSFPLALALSEMRLPHRRCSCMRKQIRGVCRCYWTFRNPSNPTEQFLIEAALDAERHYERTLQELFGDRLSAGEINVARIQANALRELRDSPDISHSCRQFIERFMDRENGEPRLLLL